MPTPSLAEAGLNALDTIYVVSELGASDGPDKDATGNVGRARAPLPDLLGPRVTGLTPTPDARMTSVASVTATFNEDLDPATINANTFKVADHPGNDGLWGTGDEGETYVAGTVAYDSDTDTATFTPSPSPHTVAGEYGVWLDDSITDMAGNALDGEPHGTVFPSGNLQPGGDFVAAFTIDTTGPRVTNLTPAPGASVGSVPVVMAYFDERLNRDTVNENSFKVAHLGADSAWGGEGENADRYVPGAVAYSPALDMATFTPSEGALADLGVYGVWLDSATITDSAGNRLNGDFAGTFPSGDDQPGGDFRATFTKILDTAGPRVIGLSPLPGAAVSSLLGVPGVTVLFDEPVNGDTVTAPGAFRVFTGPGPDSDWSTLENNPFVAGSVVYHPDTYGATFRPDDLLIRTVGEYVVWLEDSIVDGVGNRLDGEWPGDQFTFPSGDGAPGGDLVAAFTLADETTGPRVRSLWPLPGSTVPLVPSVIAQFDEPVTVPKAAFTITDPGGADVDGSFVYSAVTRTAIFTPSRPLTAEGHYTVTLRDSVTDGDGIQLDGEWPGFAPGFPSGNGAPGEDFVAGFTIADSLGPRVVALSPLPGSTTVDSVQMVLAQFSEPLDPDTVTADTFKVASAPGDDYKWGTEDDTYVDAFAVQYSAETYTAVFVPGSRVTIGREEVVRPSPLTTPGEYGVWLNGQVIKDRASSPNLLDGEWPGRTLSFPSGNGMPGGDFAAAFTISAETSGPRVMGLWPQPGTAVPGVPSVVVQFDKALDPATLTNAFKLSSAPGGDELWGTGDDTYVNGTVQYKEYTATYEDFTVQTYWGIFTPSDRLTAAGEYAVCLAEGLTDAGGHLLDGEWPGSALGFPSGNGEAGGGFVATFTKVADVLGPRLMSLWPRLGTTVANLTRVVAQFNEPLDPATVTPDTFKVSSAPGPDGQWGNGDDTYLEGSVSYNADTSSAIFVPKTGPVGLPGVYVVWLDGTESITDLAGNRLDGEWDFASRFRLPSGDGRSGGDFLGSFTVGDISGPRVTSVWPSPGSVVSSLSSVVVGFDEALNPATVTNATFKVSSAPGPDLLWGTGDDTYVDGSVSYTADTRTALFTPTAALSTPGEYGVWLDDTVTDAAGNRLDGEYPGRGPGLPSGDGAPGGDFVATLTIGADTTGPRVVQMTPGPGSTVSGIASVAVVFDEDLNPASVTASTFRVSSAAGPDAEWGTADDTYVPGTVSYEAVEPRALFTPNSPLTAQGEYGVWLDGSASVTDAAGNVLDGEYSRLTGGLPSGDGAPGGDFVATLTVGADTTGPRVTRLTPRPGLAVASVESVTAQFDEDVNAVTEATFKVSSDRGSDGLWGTGDDTYLSGSVSYNPDTYTATFLPSEALSARGEYAVWLDGASIQDLAGIALDGEWPGRLPGFPSGDGTPGGDFLGTFQVSRPGIMIEEGDLEEGDRGTSRLFLTVSLTGPLSQTVTVQYATQDRTATAGSDYTSASGTLTFRPGETREQIVVEILGDTDVEPDELFYVNLSNPVNAWLMDSTGGGRIVNDDETRWTLRRGEAREYVDADGDVFRLAYKGSGAAEVTLGAVTELGADVAAITFTGATSATQLTSTLIQRSEAGQGRTTIESITARGQSLGTLDFSLVQRGLAVPNQTSLMGAAEIGRNVSRFAVGADVLGDVAIGGRATNLAIGGQLDGDLTVAGSITKALLGSMGSNARLSSTAGSILRLETRGDMNGEVAAGQHLGTVRSGAVMGAALQAGLDIQSVFSAADITSTDGLTAGRDIKKVEATGRLAADLNADRNIGTVKANAITGDLLAVGNITKVEAASIEGSRIVAGTEGGGKATVGTVQVREGGLRDAEIEAARSVSKVTTTGRLENTWVIAGLGPGPDAAYGKHVESPNQAADNVSNLKARISRVTAAEYQGDVRIMTGGKSLGRYTIGGARQTASAVVADNILTLIYSVRRPDGQYVSTVV